MQKQKLKDIAVEIFSGGTPTTKDESFWGGDIPWITSADIDESFSIHPKKFLTSKAKNKILPANNILIVSRVGLGKIAYNKQAVAFSQDVQGVVIKEGFYVPYLVHALAIKVRKFKDIGRGATIKGVTKSDLENIEIPVPNFQTQKQIASILETADRARQQRKAANALTEQFLQSSFLHLFGDPARNEKGWEVKNLSKLTNESISYGVVQPGDSVEDGVPIIRVGDFSGMSISNGELKKIASSIETKYSRTRIKGDEILIACVGSIGRVALVDESQIGFNIVRAVARIRCDQSKINRLYLAFYLSTPMVQSYFTNETRTVSQPTLNIKQIAETDILVPPLSLQQHFASLVADAERLRQKQQQSERDLEELFQSLLHKYFGGQPYNQTEEPFAMAAESEIPYL